MRRFFPVFAAALALVLAPASLSTPSVEAGGKGDLEAYLDKMDRQNAKYVALAKDVRAIQKLEGLDNDGKVSAAEHAMLQGRIARTRKGYEAVARGMRDVSAPRALRTAHGGIVKSARLLADELVRAARGEAALYKPTAKNTDQVGAWLRFLTNKKLFAAPAKLRRDWKSAVTAYAKRVDVSVPPWVRNLKP